MNEPLPNTVFLRLEGPLQSWGTTSRFVVRDTGTEPTKSGILGMICAAIGLRREQTRKRLVKLNRLVMGVRVDRPGTLLHDYHTVGAGYGVMAAKGILKETSGTSEYETFLSRRYYLADASFLVALHGSTSLVSRIACRLSDPVWPPFLGRKSCVPSLPVMAGTGRFESLEKALTSPSQPSRPRLAEIDELPASVRLVLEVPAGQGPLPREALRIPDSPVSFPPLGHDSRYVVERFVSVPHGDPLQSLPDRPEHLRVGYGSKHWKQVSGQRRDSDHDLCVFCKQPAETVHHITYERAGAELISDLRSLCHLCHDAITMLEYGADMTRDRIDPCDPIWRDTIRQQRAAIIADRIPRPLRSHGE